MACGEQPDEDEKEMEEDDVSVLRPREEELRSGCEELQEELQSLEDGEDAEEKSSATFWRELERD